MKYLLIMLLLSSPAFSDDTVQPVELENQTPVIAILEAFVTSESMECKNVYVDVHNNTYGCMDEKEEQKGDKNGN